PLIDTTSDHEIVVSPQQAGASLQERLRSGGAVPRPIERPSGMRCEVNESGGKATIVIPRVTSPLAVGFAVVASSVVMLLVAPFLWRIFSKTGVPVVFRLFFIGVLIYAFGILPVAASGLGFGGVRNSVVTASSAGLTIEQAMVWRRRKTHIA